MANRYKSFSPDPSIRNVEAVAKLEQDALLQRTWAERFSEGVVRVVGNVAFLAANVLVIAGWTIANLNMIPGVRPFDEHPFDLLALVVSTESLILTIFVLISQNRIVRQAEKRAHLDLQVGLLAEQELTAIVEMVHKLCEHVGVNVDSSKHAETFGQPTDVHSIAQRLNEKMPSG
jgi:uncharacterized membrane protein